MECSPATLKRLIAYMRDILGAPIVNSRGQGYFYDPDIAFELPGLWFNAEELHALLSMRRLLEHTGPGVLKTVMAPAEKRIDHLLARSGEIHVADMDRIRILSMLPRSHALPHFARVATSVLERRQLAFTYAGRERGELSKRTVSPQRLTHYRDNWYLDALCHKRNALRTFSLECMADVQMLDETAKDVAESELNAQLGSAYGIFSGLADKQAVLRFTPERARWVADEQWHPQQQSHWLADGRYELKIPYADPTELILDICRYGPDVEVTAPQSLRDAVAVQLRQAANQYR